MILFHQAQSDGLPALIHIKQFDNYKKIMILIEKDSI